MLWNAIVKIWRKSESSLSFSYENTITEVANLRPVKPERRDEFFLSSTQIDELCHALNWVLLIHYCTFTYKFGNFNWYKSNFFENFKYFSNTAWFWSSKAVYVNVICFKIRSFSTCTGWTAVLHAPPNQLPYCKCKLIYTALLMTQFHRT